MALSFLELFNLFQIVSCCVGKFAAFLQKLVKVVRQVSSSYWDLLDGMWDRITFINRHGMSDPISNVQHCPCCPSGGKEGKH